MITEETKQIIVLGKTFSSEEERRTYFREELRKKLPELKKMDGFPIGEDEDILNLSDPPYYTACPNPWLNDFIAEWEEAKKQLVKEGKRDATFEVTEAYGPNQFAYAKGKGCKDALATNVLQWIRWLHLGRQVALYCSDVSGAFDRVRAARLIQKLQKRALPATS